MNVTLCGPAGLLDTLVPEQVVIEIDADDFYVAAGQQNIACRLYVPSNGKIFALGSYVIQCKIEVTELAHPLSLASLASSPEGRALGIKMKFANTATPTLGEVALR